MELIHIGAHELKEQLNNKKMILFGAGRVCQKVLKRFAAYEFEKQVAYVVDNSETKWGTNITINGRELEIQSPSYMCKQITNEVIVIMVKESESIVSQLKEYKSLSNSEIYLYPKNHFCDQEKMEQYGMDMPLTDTILTYGDGDTHENAQALFEYFQENKLLGRYKWVWICTDPSLYKETEHVKYIKRELYEGVPSREQVLQDSYYRNTSRFLFYENRFLFKTRPEQIAVYLKHGTFMLKNVKGKIVIPEEVFGAICTSHSYADLASEQESIAKEKLIFCGSPRLDFLYKEKHVLETLGYADENSKFVLWLPTLRQTVGLLRNDVKEIAPYGMPLMRSEDDFETLDECLCSRGMKLVIKPHPHQDLSVYKIGKYKNIIFVPQSELDKHEFTIHSLMRECDALISDYSSVAFDYMLLDRPIAYTIDDMGEYQIGFSVKDPLHYMPGEKLKSVGEMLDFLVNISDENDVFKKERRDIRDYVHEYQDEKNSERFLKIMEMI